MGSYVVETGARLHLPHGTMSIMTGGTSRTSERWYWMRNIGRRLRLDVPRMTCHIRRTLGQGSEKIFPAAFSFLDAILPPPRTIPQ